MPVLACPVAIDTAASSPGSSRGRDHVGRNPSTCPAHTTGGVGGLRSRMSSFADAHSPSWWVQVGELNADGLVFVKDDEARASDDGQRDQI